MEASRQPTATTLRLYEVGAELEAVVEELIEGGGELTPELETRLDEWTAAFHDKAERVALYIQNLQGLAKAAKQEADRLKELASVRQNAADRLKAYLQGEMEATGERKIETPRANLWLQKNGRPSIRWMRNVEEIPAPFKRVKVELDGNAAYEEYRTGGELPEGFEVEVGHHLRIR